jgi:hypothetical protein
MDGTFRAADIPEDILDAIRCVTKVFDEALASGRHKPGDWRLLDVQSLWTKLNDHGIQLYWNDDEDHLANFCCRALMLLQLREEKRK